MAADGWPDGLSLVEVRDRNGNRIARLELNLAEVTPDDVLAHLKSEKRIADRDPGGGQQIRSWLAFNRRELVPDRPLALQGVEHGSVLSVDHRHLKGADRERLRRELQLLRQMAVLSSGQIEVIADAALRTFFVTLRVRGPVAGASSDRYVILDEHELRMTITDDYPMTPPLLRLGRPVLVPNCWPTGEPCLFLPHEDPWRPNRTLVDVVRDVVELVQGVRPNYGSPAFPYAADLWKRSGRQLRRRIGEPYVAPVVDPSQREQGDNRPPLIRTVYEEWDA